jgi:rhodanese-related sulfurtransferase
MQGRALASLILMLATCVAHAGHDHRAGHEPDASFRSGERPTFARTVDVATLARLVDGREVTVLDVRLVEDFDADPVLIPGALRADPEHMDAWLIGVPRTRPVVVYCVAGRWVSQKAATLLEREGLEVYSLEGGLQSWQTAHDD